MQHVSAACFWNNYKKGYERVKERKGTKLCKPWVWCVTFNILLHVNNIWNAKSRCDSLHKHVGRTLKGCVTFIILLHVNIWNAKSRCDSLHKHVGRTLKGCVTFNILLHVNL